MKEASLWPLCVCAAHQTEAEEGKATRGIQSQLKKQLVILPVCSTAGRSADPSGSPWPLSEPLFALCLCPAKRLRDQLSSSWLGWAGEAELMELLSCQGGWWLQVSLLDVSSGDPQHTQWPSRWAETRTARSGGWETYAGGLKRVGKKQRPKEEGPNSPFSSPREWEAPSNYQAKLSMLLVPSESFP